jgi:5-methylcytosine-specific restriction endonuclease McrBC regulatory subunit McrC
LATQIRFSEWSRVVDHGLAAETCQEVDAAAEAWRILNGLPVAPLSFAGLEGRQLCARQYVGVIEVNDVVIEIYPKLDSALIAASNKEPLAPSVKVDTVMHNLLWMLEVAKHRDLVETTTAHLEEAPLSFFDLFAYLLGKNLLPELERGVAHTYVTFEDDIKTVRGRIGLVEQVTRNWNRFDRVFCAWDEFTPNTAINRLFKCACQFLAERVNYMEAARLLIDCRALLSEVDDVSPVTALREIENLRLDRSVDRFRTAFDLARRLLAGIGHSMGVGSANTFVFLLDMNAVFEDYVHAVLESHFKTVVQEQKYVGSLLDVHPGSISQLADYYWRDGTFVWIGDAKYKHLAKGQQRALRFRDLESEENESDGFATLAGQVLSAADVRQLTTYAELVRLREELLAPPTLMLVYPFVGSAEQCISDRVTAWNGSVFWLTPVQVRAQDSIGEAICFPRMEAGTLEPAAAPL